MADLVGPILDVLKCIGRTVSKYLKYQRKFTEYVDGLEQAQRGLNNRKVDIQHQLQDEHHIGKKPKQEVETWLEKAKKKLDLAQDVEDKARRGNYLFRSCLGKLVDETTQAMQEVHTEGVFPGILVVNDPSTIAVNLPAPELVGEANVREEIYQYLMGDEVGMIGVWGMGGIGKTTIMKDVHNRLLNERVFQKLIWTTVSEDFDIRKIQNDIPSQLNGEGLSKHENTMVRAGKLSEMLRKQGRCVLILDDVWQSFSLEDVGILEPTANGCKLVLTTRSGEVVRSMGCKGVQVACLSMDKAMDLFLSKVGQDMLPNPTLESFMKRIVGECGGLPLAIVTLAGCMRGISDPRVWQNAIVELTGRIRNLRDMEKKVFVCLRFSYDRLQKIDRDCFLCCALYPEDREIEKEEIIEYWMEEGLIDEMGSRKVMEDSGYSILQKLEENCLLEKVKEGSRIKMHDLVRDMALSITEGRFLVRAGKQLEELPHEEKWSEDLEKVSLMYNSISTIPQNMKSPTFQKLTTLLLSNNSLKEIPESFFEHFPNLKILDLSDNPIENLPNSFSSLQKLTTLLLVNCYNLQSLPSLLKLQAMKKLDLEGSGIKKIPQGLETLVKLRYLNLGWMSIEIPNGLSSKLCHLQFLSTWPTSINVEEIRKLKRLEVFETRFSKVGDLNMYVDQRKKLYKYSIWVCPEDFCLEYDFKERYSKMVTFGRIEINSGDKIILPEDIQVLKLTECKGVRSLNDIGLRDAAAIDLKECDIAKCEELECVFSSNCRQLQTLESLYLDDLMNLKVIVGVGESSGCTFSSLKKIDLAFCWQIKNLLLADWDLPNLEEIYVYDCANMEEIIVSKEGVAAIPFILPKLRRLELTCLPELKGIYSENGVMVCDSLQIIGISHCPKLKRIPLYLPLLEGKPYHLQEIRVDPKECWDSMEWDHPNPDDKNVLLPLLRFWDGKTGEWKQTV